MNRIILLGRLTRDPELRRTQSGTAVASFSLAVDRRYASDGERQTDFIDVVAWRQRGEFVSKHFTKGQMCLVEGSLQIRDWTDKGDNKRKSVEVVADNIYFTESKSNRGSNDNPATRQASEPELEDIDDDDDLPF